MNDLSTETTGRALMVEQAPSPSGNLLAQIVEAARDPTVDAGKMEAMANLAMKLQDRELQAQFNRDLASAIMEMPRISKRGVITIPAKDGRPERVQGKFAKFEDLDRVVSPILARHNLVIRFELGSDQGTTARPILMHTNGVTERGDALRLPPDTSGSKNNAQAVGSSSSYAKRYAMCAALNIVTEDEDDDGRGGALPDDPPNDRQLRLIKQAEEAVSTGTYDDFFSKLPVKDRAWLIDTGRHAGFGGEQVILPRQEPKKPDQAPPSQTTEDRADPPPAKRQTAEEWFEDYKRKVNNAADLDQLRGIQERASGGLGKIKADHPALWSKVEDLHAFTLDKLSRGSDFDEDSDQ